MGRIKSTMVKKAARQLLAADEAFTQDFNHNKKVLYRKMPSKSISNKIAGYITRLKRANVQSTNSI